MISVSETIVDALGNEYAAKSVTLETVGTPVVADSIGLVGSTRSILTTDANGLVSAQLLPGRYRLAWLDRTQRSEWQFVVPYTGGPYLIRHLGCGDVEAGQRQGWRFGGINYALIQFRNATTGNWHSPVVDNSGGSPAFGFAAANDEFDGPNWKESDSCWWLYSPIGGTWHALYINGEPSTPELAIGTAAEAVASNHRIKNGRHQFLNTSDGLYHSLFITGAAGSETYAIGPGES